MSFFFEICPDLIGLSRFAAKTKKFTFPIHRHIPLKIIKIHEKTMFITNNEINELI